MARVQARKQERRTKYTHVPPHLDSSGRRRNALNCIKQHTSVEQKLETLKRDQNVRRRLQFPFTTIVFDFSFLCACLSTFFALVHDVPTLLWPANLASASLPCPLVPPYRRILYHKCTHFLAAGYSSAFFVCLGIGGLVIGHKTTIWAHLLREDCGVQGFLVLLLLLGSG
jgi:hypothetical protein